MSNSFAFGGTNAVLIAARAATAPVDAPRAAGPWPAQRRRFTPRAASG